jgi:hypothetical protein
MLRKPNTHHRGASPQHRAPFGRRYCRRSHAMRIMAASRRVEMTDPTIAAVELELS